jgi:hypothetical protein
MSKNKTIPERTWENPEREVKNPYYFIDHLDVQKRFRVLEGQHMKDIMEALTPYNYLTEFVRFMKSCANLSRCYPNHEDLGHVDEIRRMFWEKYQIKVKTVIKPQIRKIYKMEIRKTLRIMRMYGEQ